MAECLKCGNTGIKINGKPCECGCYVEPTKVDPLTKNIPEMYRNSSHLVGQYEIIVGELDKKKTFQKFLTRFVEDLLSNTGHPSVFIDLSDSLVGAYEVYYAILEKCITIKGDVPQEIANLIRVNELDLNQLKDCDLNLKNGKPLRDCYAHIISDFPINKYTNLGDYMKIVNLVDGGFPSKYPLNMYHLKVKSTMGGI